MWQEIHGFKSPGEYDSFLKYIEGQILSEAIKEIEIDENYHKGEIYGGRWFKNVKTKEIWRFVPPDPAFSWPLGACFLLMTIYQVVRLIIHNSYNIE